MILAIALLNNHRGMIPRLAPGRIYAPEENDGIGDASAVRVDNRCVGIGTTLSPAKDFAADEIGTNVIADHSWKVAVPRHSTSNRAACRGVEAAGKDLGRCRGIIRRAGLKPSAAGNCQKGEKDGAMHARWQPVY